MYDRPFGLLRATAICFAKVSCVTRGRESRSAHLILSPNSREPDQGLITEVLSSVFVEFGSGSLAILGCNLPVSQIPLDLHL